MHKRDVVSAHAQHYQLAVCTCCLHNLCPLHCNVLRVLNRCARSVPSCILSLEHACCEGFIRGGGGALPPPPPQKKEGERGGGEREVGGEGGREIHVCSLREAILFVGGVRKRGENNRGKREKERDMLHV